MDMRMLASILLTVLASFGIVVTGGAGPALACSCAFSRMPEYVGFADEVFTGTLVDVERPSTEGVWSSTDPVTYTVTVDAVYRGEIGPVAVFESAVSSASCGLDGMVVDRRYLVFATAVGGRREASSCGGTATATPRRLDAVQRLLGDPATPSVVEHADVSADAVRTDDDVPSSSGLPGRAVGVSLIGALALLAAGPRLRRR